MTSIQNVWSVDTSWNVLEALRVAIVWMYHSTMHAVLPNYEWVTEITGITHTVGKMIRNSLLLISSFSWMLGHHCLLVNYSTSHHVTFLYSWRSQSKWLCLRLTLSPADEVVHFEQLQWNFEADVHGYFFKNSDTL